MGTMDGSFQNQEGNSSVFLYLFILMDSQVWVRPPVERNQELCEYERLAVGEGLGRYCRASSAHAAQEGAGDRTGVSRRVLVQQVGGGRGAASKAGAGVAH